MIFAGLEIIIHRSGPAGFLMFQGAGLNPFVAMPSAFGLLLFLLLPYKMPLRFEALQKSIAIVMAAFFSLFVISLSHGIVSHTTCPIGSMDALKQIVEVIMTDARQHQTSNIAYATTFIRWAVNASVKNILIYELHGTLDVQDAVSVGNIRFRSPVRESNIAAPVEWENIEGTQPMLISWNVLSQY